MPELAKVEQIRGKCEAFALNRKIISITSRKDNKVFCYKQPDEIEKALLNKTITKIGRRGKHLWWELDTAPHIAFHFGMTGKIKYEKNQDNKLTKFEPPFWKLVLLLDNNTFIAYITKQRLGKIRIHQQLPQLCEPIKDLGYDPQHNMCTKEQFIHHLSKKKKRSKLKPTLMDQHFIAGIGSWIADEICYQSGIVPDIKCQQLSQQQLQSLYESTVSICNYSLSVNGEGKQYPSNWLFHYRWPKKDYSKGKGGKNKIKQFKNCLYDGEGNKITFTKVDNRRTAIVYDVQSKDTVRVFNNAETKGRLDIDKKKANKTIDSYFMKKEDDDDEEGDSDMKENTNNSNNGSGKYKKGKDCFKKMRKDKKNKNKLKSGDEEKIKLNKLGSIATKENMGITELSKSKRMAMIKQKTTESDESSSDSH